MADAQVLAKYPERKASRKQVIADSLRCKNNGKITANKHIFEIAMTSTQAVKRFDATLPMSSYELVQRAATLSGMTVRSFVAMATFERALKLLKATEEAKTPKIVLNNEESETLAYLLDNEDQIFGPTLSNYRQLASKVRVVKGK